MPFCAAGGEQRAAEERVVKDIPHSTQLSCIGPSLENKLGVLGKYFLVIYTWVKWSHHILRKGFMVWSPVALLLSAWIQSPSAASEMVVSQMQGVQSQSRAEPCVSMNGNHFSDAMDSRRCDRSGAGGGRASSTLCGAVPCA